MIDYRQTWYVLQRGSGQHFPDGRIVPAKYPRRHWSTTIWIKLGEGDDWKDAITFGANYESLESAARDFGAKGIVWLEPYQKIGGGKP